MVRKLPMGMMLMAGLALPVLSWGFCGIYVSHAGSQVYNQASKVVIARKDEQTVLTMINDFQGDAKDFAMVVPVPTVIAKDQIRVVDRAAIDKLDAFTAPRLTKYFDRDPCVGDSRLFANSNSEGLGTIGGFKNHEERDPEFLGVTIEASYTVGEYDILVLSAQQSEGLLAWLKQNGYAVSDTAASVLGSYIKQDMRFFVAKVNLPNRKQLGEQQFLRPLQISFNTPKFMLPIRLGMANAKSSQELFILSLTHRGAVETINYPTREIPTNIKIPLYVEHDFNEFYKHMFDQQVAKQNQQAVFMEYANDIKICDPCVANRPTDKDLAELGVFWLDDPKAQDNVFVTRLHVRYDQAHFPEDLIFYETTARTSFQANYSVTVPYKDHDIYENYLKKGLYACPQSARYYQYLLPLRLEEEAGNLSMLTGDDINQIRKRLELPEEAPLQKTIWQLLDNH